MSETHQVLIGKPYLCRRSSILVSSFTRMLSTASINSSLVLKHSFDADGWTLLVGEVLGWALLEGELDGMLLGSALSEGELDGLLEGALDGMLDGMLLGSALLEEGEFDGLVEGALDGLVEGELDGRIPQPQASCMAELPHAI
jgi:hypothetical protein